MNDNEVVIQAIQLGKCYHIYKNPFDRLKQLILDSKKKYYREFWALRDINFTVRRGESFGIIGSNGSGKSTLLQLICNTLHPTQGHAKIIGRVGALLELGAGFNPEFTGIENIYTNAAIMGLKRKSVKQILREIIEFADIGDFINKPVKMYSSGMFVRLAFALHAHINPDILIIDEALSVGDIFFQQKCAGRMLYLKQQGTTLIFVSHDMSTVRDLCENVLYLKSGEMKFIGPSADAIRLYHSEQIQKHALLPTKNSQAQTAISRELMKIIEEFKNTAYWVTSEKPTHDFARIIALKIIDKNNNHTLQVQIRETLLFQVLYQSLSDTPVHVSVTLKNKDNHIINSSGTYTHKVELPLLNKNEFAFFELKMQCMLQAGEYDFRVNLSSITKPNRAQKVDATPWLGPLIISWNKENDRPPFMGMFGLPVKISERSLNTE